MSCTLGPVGVATSAGGDGLTLQSPNRIGRDGDSLKVGGDFHVTDAEGRALAEQLSGLGPHNPDEPIVPFTYSASQPGGSLDGYYAVLGVKVDYAKLASGLFSWDADLVKVSGFQAPLLELRFAGALRANDLSYTTPIRGWVGLNPKADLLHGYAMSILGSAMTGIGEIEDAGATATNLLLYDNDASPAPIPRGAVVYTVAPEDHYQNAAKIEASYDGGTTWRRVVGRQLQNLPTQVRVSNDLIRFQHSSGNAFTFGGYLGGWETDTFKFTYGGASATSLGAPASVTVLRNSPECCIVRFWLATSVANGNTAYIDIKITRSAWWIEGALCSASNSSATFGVFRGSAKAGTSVTYGLDASTVDGNGNKYQLRSPKTVTKDTTNGGIHHAGTTRLPFAISYDTLQDATLTTTVAYAMAMQQHQRIVAR